MQSVVITRHGGLDVFARQERPIPVLREWDLLVQVQATSVNPVDCKVRRASQFPRQFPLVLGYDVSGTVVAVGDRVSDFRPGDEVYGSPSLMRDGANAEYVAVDSRSVALKPDHLDHRITGVLPLVVLTAWEGLYQRARLRSGQTVLIHGGAGGVGHIAIQLAKLRQCFVITTAGREESIQFCRHEPQADVVINYQQEDVVQRVMDITNGRGCPIILDTVGGQVLEKSLDCLAVNGQIVTLLPPSSKPLNEKLLLKNVTLHYEFMGIPTVYNLYPEHQGRILREISDLLGRNRLRPYISRTLKLFEALPEAHRLQEYGDTLGKIAIVP